METHTYATGHPEPEFLRLPTAGTLFQRRAFRFRQLAAKQASLARYLDLMADLAEAQHRLSQGFPNLRLPEPVAGKAPLDISIGSRDPAWRAALREIARRFDAAGGALAGKLHRLRTAPDGELETWADRLLAADLETLDPAIAPFLAAALQVQWTLLAARLDPAAAGWPEPAFRCPVCGSLPVASVLQTGGEVRGLRYLCCSLCAAEWHRVRIHCVHCGSSKSVAYFGIEGAGQAVKAEACSECNSYLKVMDREKDPEADPCADDIATLALDILMAEEGYDRLGFNPLLIPGE